MSIINSFQNIGTLFCTKMLILTLLNLIK